MCHLYSQQAHRGTGFVETAKLAITYCVHSPGYFGILGIYSTVFSSSHRVSARVRAKARARANVLKAKAKRVAHIFRHPQPQSLIIPIYGPG